MKPKTKFKQTEIGLIPEDWEIIQLGSIGKVCMCKRVFKNETSPVGEVPFYKINTINKNADAFISKHLFEKYKSNYPYPKIGDILLSTSGTVGRTLIFDGKPAYFQDSNIVWLKHDLNKLDKKFLFYCYQRINWSTDGSTIKRIYNNSLLKTQISLPSLSEQRAIASVLSSFDDKIELLEKQNETLEKIGEALFKHWFVDFEFPNEKGLPYKSSGGKMIWSEELQKEIPAGWKIENYGELLEFERGVEPGSKSYLDECEEGSILFYKVGDLLSEEAKTYVKKENLNNKIANCDDILVSFDGTVGRVKIGISGGYSTGIRKVYSKNKHFEKSFIYFLVKSNFIQNKINEFAKGTTILHAGESINNFFNAIPNKNNLDEFSVISNPVFQKLLENENQIKRLKQTRDLLLPKLMSGKIRITNLS